MRRIASKSGAETQRDHATLSNQCRLATDQMGEAWQVMELQGRVATLESELAESRAKIASAEEPHPKTLQQKRKRRNLAAKR